MSHKITTRTGMKDQRLIRGALNTAKLDFDERDGVFYIKGGKFRGVSINSKTGDITGDSDWHGGILGDLRQHYAEAHHMDELQLAGCEVLERNVLKTGQVQLICRGTFTG